MYFEIEYSVRWSDLDPNLHMNSVAYLQYATHTRFAFLKEHGFGVDYFFQNKISPVLFEEKVNFVAELKVQETFLVNDVLVDISETGHKWAMKNEIKNESGELCAVVSTAGGWMCLKTRKIAPPPAEVSALLMRLPKGRPFEALRH